MAIALSSLEVRSVGGKLPISLQNPAVLVVFGVHLRASSACRVFSMEAQRLQEMKEETTVKADDEACP